MQGNKLLPYIIRVIQKENLQNEGSKIPKVIKKDALDGGRIRYILRLPELPAGTAYSSLEIDADRKFEANVSVMGQMKPEDMNEWNREKIYKLDTSLDTGVKRNIRFFKPDRFLFAKIEIDGPDLDYKFKKVNYIPIQQRKEIGKPISLESIKIVNDEDIKSMVYYIDNPNRIPYSKLRLGFQEKNFQRSFRVYEFDSIAKEYYYFSEGTLQKTKDQKSKLEIQFPRESKNPLKLELLYEDNSPLNLTSLELLYAQQELLFEITPEILEDTNSLYLYYGNQYQKSPNFDAILTSRLVAEEVTSVYLSLENQEPNPNFGYSIVEPPLSVWIMRIFFYLGLGIFGYLGYRVFQVYGNSSLSHNVNVQTKS